MEQNRIWHEPEVGILANAITPGVSCSAWAYDSANRRWYQLNVSDKTRPSGGSTGRDEDSARPSAKVFQVPADDDWLSSTVEKHVSDCYKSTGSPPTWNIINTTSVGHPVSFGLDNGDYPVGRPIYERFFYGHKTSDQLPTIRSRALTNKTYLGRGADLCDWEGQTCVFKRIEFDRDNKMYENEIRVREHLIQQITQESTTTPLDVGNEMMRRFKAVPILAVVLHDETSRWILGKRPPNSVLYGLEDEDNVESKEEEEEEQESHAVAGFVMPYMGRSLELFETVHPDADGESSNVILAAQRGLGWPSPTTDVPITAEQLLDLVKGVRELSRCGVTHGDICYWNVVLDTSAAAPRLLLIDMGNSAPSYVNDVLALRNLLLWCVQHSPSLRENTAARKKVILASALLNEGDFDGAVEILSPLRVAKDGCKTMTSYNHWAQRVKRQRL